MGSNSGSNLRSFNGRRSMQSMTLGSWELTGNKVNAVTKKKSTHIKFTANPAHVQSQDSSITNNNSNVASQTLQHKNQSSSQSVPYAVNNVFNNNRPSTTASISLHSTKKQQMMRIASYQSNNSNNNSNSNINQRSSRNDRRRLQRYNERFDSDARSVLIGQPLAPPSVTSITSITSINSQTTLNQRSQESNDQSSINVPSSRSESSTSHASRSISRSRKRKRDDKSDKSKKDPIVFAVDPQLSNILQILWLFSFVFGTIDKNFKLLKHLDTQTYQLYFATLVTNLETEND